MYWSNTFWKDSSAIAGATGEGYLIYPGKTFEDDPIPSLRLEMIRQGIEDYELFTFFKSVISVLPMPGNCQIPNTIHTRTSPI